MLFVTWNKLFPLVGNRLYNIHQYYTVHVSYWLNCQEGYLLSLYG